MTSIVIILSIFLVGAIYYIFILRKKISKVEELERGKMEGRRSSFVSIISHQLRTPLSVIKGFLEALVTGDQGQLNDGQKDYVSEALKINLDTVKLVNDYLSVVQLDSDNIPVKPESVDLVSLAKESVKKLQLLAKANNCDLQFEEPHDKIPNVLADPIKVQQVIENIVANSIKYISGHGHTTVSLKQEGNFIVFKCEDTGVGIPEDQQADLFTKFFRAKNVINKDTKGSGLGLYLAKVIVESLGGKIWVESVEGQGTKVFFNLKKYPTQLHE